MSGQKDLKTILTDKKESLETTNLCVEIMNIKTQVKEETWSRGTNQRLLFDVNVMLNLSIISFGRGQDDF